MKTSTRSTGRNTESGSTTRQKSFKAPLSRNSRIGTTKTDGLQSGFQEEPSSLLYSPNALTPAELSLREKLLRPNKDGIVRISRKDLRRLPKLPFDQESFDGITDEDIANAVGIDPDAAPLDVDWSKASLVVPKPKIAMSIRVDPDVYDFFKATGKNYQTRMNAVLKAFMDHEKSRK
jgi:uncharacterized protein (DUF4415 family)